jgi:hypothetical protein
MSHGWRNLKPVSVLYPDVYSDGVGVVSVTQDEPETLHRVLDALEWIESSIAGWVQKSTADSFSASLRRLSSCGFQVEDVAIPDDAFFTDGDDEEYVEYSVVAPRIIRARNAVERRI